ncbi:MAG: L-aspartate oxidase [Bacteroidota bacterium]
MEHRVDFLVVGSGIAGLSFALKAAEAGKVILLTKTKPEETNTAYAQGGIAGVMGAPDSVEKHVNDTLIAGDFLCDENVVRIVASEAAERINELISWGTEFDKKADGNYDLAKEGGHSEHRILHHKDNTGFEIERALLSKVQSNNNITIYDHYFALEIITQHHLGVWVNSQTPGVEAYGVYALNTRTQKIEVFAAKSIVMATGGCGHIYESTTNPVIATGDGVAMVYRAKGTVEGMEFIQFHPTALYEPGKHPSFLISEAVRGFGAVLRNKGGEEFMIRYDERKSLAPRDIVARAIDNEMKTRGDDYVYLDCTNLDKEGLIAHFPNIYNKCLSLGIDITKDFIPVSPAAHYMCGGIKVNQSGESSIKNLFAIGECSSTGLHGANRLASNSLLEAIVFSHRASIKAKENSTVNTFMEKIPEWNAEGTASPEELVLITQSLKELHGIMSSYVGIVRSNLRLQRAFNRLKVLHDETESLYERTTVSPQLCELRNMIKVGYIVIKHAMQRKQSVGLHFNIDYPKKIN